MIFTISIFIAGVLSFLSPCILPIIPIYLGYLSTSNKPDATISIGKSFCFVLGLSTSFVILGFGSGFLGSIIQNPYFFISIGVLTILLGFYQIGVLRLNLLSREKKLDINIDTKNINSWSAFLLGFFLSFGWTPCVGPVLASVLAITASQEHSTIISGSLLLIYSLGLSIPFILLSLFYKQLITKIKLIYKYFFLIKVLGGIIIIMYGTYVIYSQINIIPNTPMIANQSIEQIDYSQKTNIDVSVYHQKFMTLSDEVISLSDLKGKKVYIKFWASWCPICLEGLPELIQLADEYKNDSNVVIYSVVSPTINREMDMDDFKAWAISQHIAVKTILDPTANLLKTFNIRGYPTSIYIDKTGNLQNMKIGHSSNGEIIKNLNDLN